MALFGRRKRKDEDPRVEEVEPADFDDLDDIDQVDRADGPYDEAEAPDDESPRLDLGSLRIPVPDGAQLQVEMDPAGPVRGAA